MIPAADITEWAGSPVLSRDGSKIGPLEAVYYDTSSEEPAFVTIKIGIIGSSRLVFAPLDGATVSPRSVNLAVDKKVVKAAPSIDMDGALEAATEPQIYAHYDMTYQPGATGERRLGRR